MNNNYKTSLISDIKSNKNHFIIFSLNEKKYAINISHVVEVINIPEMESPEFTPESIIGIFNYNGNMIKAIDLCPFLGFKTNKFSINNRLIIACYNNEYFAINTENIHTITTFQQDDIQQLPFSAENSILKQLYRLDNETINIIDIDLLYSMISRNDIKRSEIDYASLFPIDEKSKHILNLRLQHHNIQKKAFSFPINAQSEKQYILFVMNNQNYYMDIKYIKEFISMKRLNITKLPYTPNYISGMVSVKGEFFVVVDLKKFIDRESKHEVQGGKLITVEGKNFNVAFLVDDIKYIRNLKDINKSGMYSSNSEYISAEFMEENELYNILNLEKIINDDDIYINIE